MDIYFKILNHLAKNDNGEFIDITSLHSDFKILSEKARELSKSNKIQIKPPSVYSFGDDKGNFTTIGDEGELKKIKAKILMAGHEYLKVNKFNIQGLQLINSKKNNIPQEKKLKYINELIHEVVGWIGFNRSTISNFIIRAKEIIAYIDGEESLFITDIDIFQNRKNQGVGVIADWHDQIHNALLRLKFRIETESDFEINTQTKNKPLKKDTMVNDEIRIFISHGGSSLWKDVARFIEKDLNFDTIILQERPNKGRTVIEKLDEETDECEFAIIVMTAEDEQKDGGLRARQNVVHEIGFCQGRFGRENVLVLKQKGVEGFTNISGIVYEEFIGDNIKSTFHKIQQELEELKRLG